MTYPYVTTNLTHRSLTRKDTTQVFNSTVVLVKPTVETKERAVPCTLPDYTRHVDTGGLNPTVN